MDLYLLIVSLIKAIVIIASIVSGGFIYLILIGMYPFRTLLLTLILFLTYVLYNMQLVA